MYRILAAFFLLVASVATSSAQGLLPAVWQNQQGSLLKVSASDPATGRFAGVYINYGGICPGAPYDVAGATRGVRIGLSLAGLLPVLQKHHRLARPHGQPHDHRRDLGHDLCRRIRSHATRAWRGYLPTHLTTGARRRRAVGNCRPSPTPIWRGARLPMATCEPRARCCPEPQPERRARGLVIGTWDPVSISPSARTVTRSRPLVLARNMFMVAW